MADEHCLRRNLISLEFLLPGGIVGMPGVRNFWSMSNYIVNQQLFLQPWKPVMIAGGRDIGVVVFFFPRFTVKKDRVFHGRFILRIICASFKAASGLANCLAASLMAVSFAGFTSKVFNSSRKRFGNRFSSSITTAA